MREKKKEKKCNMRWKSGGKRQGLQSRWLPAVCLWGWFPNPARSELGIAQSWQLLAAGLHARGSRGKSKGWIRFPFYIKVAGLLQSRSSCARALPRSFGKAALILGVPRFQESPRSLEAESKPRGVVLCFGFSLPRVTSAMTRAIFLLTAQP